MQLIELIVLLYKFYLVSARTLFPSLVFQKNYFPVVLNILLMGSRFFLVIIL
jgi:hypothetical protein